MKQHKTEMPRHPGEKILDRPAMRHRIQQWQADGFKVVFTNGCFDLLHIGHVTLLDEARRSGDRLIVAVNSDSSVRRLKGPSRPIVPEHARAGVLAGLEAVDAVVVFDEPTPLELMVELRPDVIVKGGDYVADQIIGAKEIRSWGGSVKIVHFVDGFSTTALLERAAVKKPDNKSL